MDIKALAAQYAVPLLALVAWMLISAVLHALIAWLAGPAFATNWPNLNRFLVSSRINPVAMLSAILAALQKPPMPGDPPAPSTAAKVASKISGAISLALCGLMLLGGLFVGCVTGCTKAQGAAVAPVIRDASGAVCAIVLQAADPALANSPICTTLAEIEAATQALLGVGIARASLSQDQVYHAVLVYRLTKAAAK